MAEAMLRHQSGNRLFVLSGGVRPTARVHPLALDVMEEMGFEGMRGSCAPKSLSSAMESARTFDVYVSIDEAYGSGRSVGVGVGSGSGSGECRDESRGDERTSGEHSASPWEGLIDGGTRDELLFPSPPGHWACAADATDVHRHWMLWSPRNPSIFHERSTRKFQDVYEGEPLFSESQRSMIGASRRTLRERWVVEDVARRFAVEHEDEQRERFRAVRGTLWDRCLELLRRLESRYDEKLVVCHAWPREVSGLR
jgi:hypothetical protein